MFDVERVDLVFFAIEGQGVEPTIFDPEIPVEALLQRKRLAFEFFRPIPVAPN